MFFACPEPSEGDADTEESTVGDTQSVGGGLTGEDTDPSDEGVGTDASSEASDSSESESSSTSEGTGDAGGECDEGFVCIPGVPPGWSGPVVWTDEAGEACGGAYDQLQVSAGLDLDAPPANCNCACTPDADFECAGTLVAYEEDCEDPIVSANVDDVQACIFFFADEVESVSLVDSPGEVSCTAQVAVELPTASFGTQLSICGGVDAPFDACDEGGTICAPEAEQVQCIWRAGTHSCPADYPDSRVAYQALEDDRACSGCSCQSDGTCGGSFAFWSSSNACESNQVPTLVLDAGPSCTDLPGGDELDLQSVRWDSTPPACDVTTAPAPTGSVEAVDPITLCCLEG